MERGIVGSDIYKILAAVSYGYSITMFDFDGQGTISPINAKWFYVKPVNFMIQVPDDKEAAIRPEVFLWKSQEIKDAQTLEVLKRLKNCVNQYGHGFTVYDFGSANLPKKFSHLAQMQLQQSKITESYTGSAFRSYFNLPKARMVIVHSSRVLEDSTKARTSNVKDIFVECNGERYRVPTKNVHAAKAIVTHLNEDGQFNDKYSTYIKRQAQDLQELEDFIPHIEVQNKRVHHKKINQFIQELKDELRSLGTGKGYSDFIGTFRDKPRIGKKYIESFCNRLSTDDIKYPEAMARQFLIRECYKYQDNLQALYNNLCTDVPENELKRLAKRICLGCVNTTEPEGFEDIPDEENKVLMFGNRLIKYIEDPVLHEALENILQKPHVSELDGKFIIALGNSLIGHDKKDLFRSGSTPEPKYDDSTGILTELDEWMKK